MSPLPLKQSPLSSLPTYSALITAIYLTLTLTLTTAIYQTVVNPKLKPNFNPSLNLETFSWLHLLQDFHEVETRTN